MDISEIRKLIKLVQSSDLTEIEVTEGDQSVRISRQSTHVTVAAPAAPIPMVAPVAAADTAAPAKTEQIEANIVKSPMVGTFYCASNPDTPAFVTVGAQVNKGDTLCIIEAMKLMNEIKAEIKGKLVDVLVDNGEPVEFGQAFFVIEPS